MEPDALEGFFRAAGGGFYDYPKDGKKALWPELARIFGRPAVAGLFSFNANKKKGPAKCPSN